MAKYSVSIYGRARSIYGATSDNYANYVVSFNAQEKWYNAIELRWGVLTENPEEDPITYWKIVRSTSGVPDHPDYAETLLGGEYREDGDPEGSVQGWIGYYLDDMASARDSSAYGINLFPPGTQLTYSLWGYNQMEWKLLGSDSAFIVRGEGKTLYKMLRSLPGSWTTSGPVGYLTGEPEDNDLSLFLSGFAFYYDLLRTKTYSLSKSSDYTLIPVQLLDGVIQNYGFVKEPALGDSYHRTLYKSGYYINSYKGTEAGVSAFISALTHWGSELTIGNNLMLDASDASFEYSSGSWEGPLTHHKYVDFTTTSNVFSEEIISPYELLILQRDDGYYTRGEGFASVILETGGTATLTCGENNPIAFGIPVEKGLAYEFSIYCRRSEDAISHPTDIQLNIKFYNKFGELDPTYTVTSVAEATDTVWKKHKVISSTIPVTADISYASVSVIFTDGSHNKHLYLDYASFGVKETQDQYQDARKVLITLYGDRENLIPNPGFDNNTSGWTLENSLDNVGLTPHYTTSAKFGNYVAKLVAGDANLSLVSSWINVLPNRALTFSAYVSNDVVGDRNVKIKFIFSMPLNQASQLISNNEFINEPYEVESEEFDIDTLTDGRVSFTTQTPDESIFGVYPNVKVYIIFPDSEEDDVFYVDSCLLEHTGEVRTYFQGNGAPLPLNPVTEDFIENDDTRWEHGTIINYLPIPTFSSIPIGLTAWTNVTIVPATSEEEAYGLVSAGDIAGTTAVFEETFNYGSSVTASIYVKGDVNSTYTLSLGGPGIAEEFTQVKYKVHDTNWVRLSITATASDSLVGFSIESDSENDWYIDKAQVELSEYASKYVGPEVGQTDFVEKTNGMNTVTMWKYWGRKEIGRSYYFTKFFNKITRLNTTLEQYVPMFTDFEIIYGDDYYKRLNNISPYIKEFSFENSLEGWTGIGTDFVYRKFANPPDYAIEGSSYAVAETTSAGTYSLKSPLIKVSPNTNYHVSAAVREKYGDDVTLKIYRYFDGTETPTPITSVSTTTGSYVWSYARIVNSENNAEIFNTGDNLFIRIEIESTTTSAGGSEIHVDRVILRPQ